MRGLRFFQETYLVLPHLLFVQVLNLRFTAYRFDMALRLQNLRLASYLYLSSLRLCAGALSF